MEGVLLDRGYFLILDCRMALVLVVGVGATLSPEP